MNNTRKNYLTWDELFFSIAMAAAKRSKDPSTQNGACIVGDFNIVKGIGYNGFARGIKDTDDRWEKSNKYKYVCHAEVNAIDNSNSSVRGSTIYLWSSKNYFPCEVCMLRVIQNGISKIKMIGSPDVGHDMYDWNIINEMADESGVKFEFSNLNMKQTLSKIEGSENE